LTLALSIPSSDLLHIGQVGASGLLLGGGAVVVTLLELAEALASKSLLEGGGFMAIDPLEEGCDVNNLLL
jgi:hypothetical protein